MKKVIDIALWSTASFLLIPSGLILISWNALPSQPMYGVKVGLEKTLLAILPSSVLQSSMQVRFTERRFDEAEQLLATNLASTGLNNLDQQVLETQRSIQYIDSPVDQAKAADQYIQTLRKVSTKLAQKQQTIASQQVPFGQTAPSQEQQYQTGGTTVVNNYYYYPAPTAQQPTQGAPTSQPNVKSPGKTSQPAAAAARPAQTPTPTTTQSPASSTTPESDLSTQVNNTQQQIENTIREMERIRQNAEEAKRKQEEKKEEKQKEEKSKKEEKNEEKEEVGQED